jgi:hypothetical protein
LLGTYFSALFIVGTINCQKLLLEFHAFLSNTHFLKCHITAPSPNQTTDDDNNAISRLIDIPSCGNAKIIIPIIVLERTADAIAFNTPLTLAIDAAR